MNINLAIIPFESKALFLFKEKSKFLSHTGVLNGIHFKTNMVVIKNMIPIEEQAIRRQLSPAKPRYDFQLWNYRLEIKTAAAKSIQVPRRKIEMDLEHITENNNQTNNHSYVAEFHVYGLDGDSTNRVLSSLRSDNFASDLREMLWKNVKLKERLQKVTKPGNPEVKIISGVILKHIRLPVEVLLFGNVY